MKVQGIQLEGHPAGLNLGHFKDIVDEVNISNGSTEAAVVNIAVLYQSVP